MKIFTTAMLLFVFAGCAKNTSDSASSDVSDAIESQIATLNSATSDVNAGNTGTAVAYLSPGEQRLLDRQTFGQRLGELADRLFDSSLHATAVSVSCSSGSFTDTPSTSFSGNSGSVLVTRQWNNCTGDLGVFKRNGTVYLQFSGLQGTSPYVQNAATLVRATSGLTMTRTKTGNYVDISGNDTTNQASSTNGNQKFTWTSNTAYTLNINETRTGKMASGATLFRHIVTTPTILSVSFGNATRTIQSGSIKIAHTLANFDVTTTFSNAVWSTSSCQPVSGSATVTVSGSISGTGTLKFNNGTIDFTYGDTSGSITTSGC
ncbi:MAG: hypothetical protein KF713_09585 [Turneriella sp.]|nr:hypothetical protein [Turneriella sp.]